MEKQRKITLCDVPWWEELKTDDEKDKYCREHYDLTYSEYLEVLDSPLPIREALNQVMNKRKHS